MNDIFPRKGTSNETPDNNDNDSDKKPKPNQPTKTFISELAGVGIA